MFRIVFSGSRKSCSEVGWRQTTEAFITALENAFQHFGGVPRTLVIDDLKDAVHQADWYGPEVHPKLQAFAAHHGAVFLPTRPYTPQHKWKIEAGIKYVTRNALRGKEFANRAAQPPFTGLQAHEGRILDSKSELRRFETDWRRWQ